MMDLTGHDVVTGTNNTNWTDVLDLSSAHNVNQALYLETTAGWTELTGHGTIELGTNTTGEIFNEPVATQTHNLVDFTHIEKLIY